MLRLIAHVFLLITVVKRNNKGVIDSLYHVKPTKYHGVRTLTALSNNVWNRIILMQSIVISL